MNSYLIFNKVYVCTEKYPIYSGKYFCRPVCYSKLTFEQDILATTSSFSKSSFSSSVPISLDITPSDLQQQVQLQQFRPQLSGHQTFRSATTSPAPAVTYPSLWTSNLQIYNNKSSSSSSVPISLDIKPSDLQQRVQLQQFHPHLSGHQTFRSTTTSPSPAVPSPSLWTSNLQIYNTKSSSSISVPNSLDIKPSDLQTTSSAQAASYPSLGTSNLQIYNNNFSFSISVPISGTSNLYIRREIFMPLLKT